MQRAAFTAGTTTIEGGPLLIGEKVAMVRSHRLEVLAAKGERQSAIAVGQQTEVADLDEAGRQHVQQETRDELNRIEAHDLDAVFVSGIPPAELHLSVAHAEQSAIRNGNPVGVACQVLQHMVGTAERGLGIDHPLLAAQLGEHGVEACGASQRSQSTGKAQLLVSVSLLEKGQHLAAEQAPQHRHGQQESGAAGDPAGVIQRESARRNQAVQVRMMTQLLAPGMEHGEETDASAETMSIGGDLHQGLRYSAEQPVINQTLVSECNCCHGFGQGEDNVRVGYGQQRGSLTRQPAIARRGLTLWAMAIAAGAIGHGLIAAGIAAFPIAAEGGSTTATDVAQDLVLLAGDNTAPTSKELLLVSMDDIGHFQPMFSHLLLRSPCEGVISRIGRSSSGLGVECSRCWETCR